MKRTLCYIAALVFCNTTVYSLTLTETIEYAIHNNPNVLSDVKDKQAIFYAIQQAKAAWYPTININAAWGPEESRNSTTALSSDSPIDRMPRRETDIKLTENLFEGFATVSEVERHRARLTSSHYKLLSTIHSVAERTIVAYLDVLKQEELVALAEENHDFHVKILDMVKSRARSGVSKQADVYQAQGRLSLAESNLIAERSNLNDARTRFYRQVGLEARNLKHPPKSFFSKKWLPKSLNKALKIAKARNPTILSADADIRAAKEQHNTAKAANYPRIDLELASNNDYNMDGTPGLNSDRSALLRLTWDIYKGGADLARQNETAYLTQQAVQIKRNAILELSESLRLSWSRYITAEAQLEWLIDHQKHAHETVIAYNKQFKIGQRNLLDLLDTQNEYFAAKRSHINGDYEIEEAEYRILRDLGYILNPLELPSIRRALA